VLRGKPYLSPWAGVVGVREGRSPGNEGRQAPGMKKAIVALARRLTHCKLLQSKAIAMMADRLRAKLALCEQRETRLIDATRLGDLTNKPAVRAEGFISKRRWLISMA
jgi:hypothetical protein